MLKPIFKKHFIFIAGVDLKAATRSQTFLSS